jgi:hypothetical protein
MMNGEIQIIVMDFNVKKDYLNLQVDITVIRAGSNLKTKNLNCVLYVAY